MQHSNFLSFYNFDIQILFRKVTFVTLIAKLLDGWNNFKILVKIAKNYFQKPLEMNKDSIYGYGKQLHNALC